ncbi:MAG TPA: pyrroloquinoline quinone precursor peptide PqqA [Myxococcota bacterium]|nr:pyrroloquinoline quinone precursor peptide PqqA [Myxococcota bacterium]
MSSNWSKPAFEEINMSAEIGAYQGDEDGSEYPPFVSPAPASDEA